jgi:hypothetical protein
MPKAKITMQAKREAVPEAFGDVPNLDPAHLNILYARRDLSTVQKGEAVGVRYIIDVQDLERTITETLDRIRERDGEKIFREAAEHVLADVAMLVEARASK